MCYRDNYPVLLGHILILDWCKSRVTQLNSKNELWMYIGVTKIQIWPIISYKQRLQSYIKTILT